MTPVSRINTSSGKQRVVLVGLAGPLDELRQLAIAAGGEVVLQVEQRRPAPDAAFFIGRGKASELGDRIAEAGVELAIFDDSLTPAQTRNLERVLAVPVVDRTGLILDIFARRARTREGKLQVELAQLTYLSARLAGRREWLSRLGGGIGTRGPGETQLEVDRRRIRTRMARLRNDLAQVRRQRKLRRVRRQRNRMPVVSLVGYTNAGKSTLFRRLSGEPAFVSAQVFSTLDTVVRSVRLSPDVSILLSDTVGFISKLPPELVSAFRATLEEVTEADLLIHVIDGSAPAWEEKMRIVDAVLTDIGCKQPRLHVFNKTDRTDGVGYPPGIQISALDGRGVPQLLDRILQALPECVRVS